MLLSQKFHSSGGRRDEHETFEEEAVPNKRTKKKWTRYKKSSKAKTVTDTPKVVPEPSTSITVTANEAERLRAIPFTLSVRLAKAVNNHWNYFGPGMPWLISGVYLLDQGWRMDLGPTHQYLKAPNGMWANAARRSNTLRGRQLHRTRHFSSRFSHFHSSPSNPIGHRS